MSSATPAPSRSADPSATQTAFPDGRVALADGVVLDDPRFANGDLAPVPIGRRNWRTYNYLALCVAQERTHTWRMAGDLLVSRRCPVLAG